MTLTDADRAALVADIHRAAHAVREAERQLARDVAEARQRGLLWSEVATGLGVSKAAAHKRFRSTRTGLVDVPLPSGT